MSLKSKLFSRLNQSLHGAGYELRRHHRMDPNRLPEDFEADKREIICKSLPYTATSIERLYNLCLAVEYVVKNDVPGCMLECGVWKGGSMMAVANMLKHLSADTRELYLFDTFGGMSAPTKDDITSSGEEASPFWEQSQRNDNDNDWCYASLEEVEANMAKTSYNKSQVHYVKGMVEETIPAGAPAQIALLRLDTDWYESTYHEMVHLYPKLSPGGVLILDDYGFWQGAKKAVDQYFDEQGIVPMLARIDDTARIMVKPI